MYNLFGHNTLVSILFQCFHRAIIATEKQLLNPRKVVRHAAVCVKIYEQVGLS